MKSLLNKVIDFSIPEKLKSPREVYWRASIISSIHITLISIVIFSELVCLIFFRDNQFPHAACTIGLLLLAFTFKKWGSFEVSGNLLAGLLFLILLPFCLTTGGLFSYDFMAMIMIPFIGFLIAGRKSGFIWMGILFCTTILLFVLEINSTVSYREVTYANDSKYYLSLILFIQLMIFGCVSIYNKGQTLIVDELHRQRDLLNVNKIELENKESELLESNASLKHFAHVASHDLKQPIRTISSFGAILQKQVSGSLTKDQNVYLDFIISGAKQMQNQINSVLNHAMIGSGKNINLEKVELLPFVENTILKLQQQMVDSKTKMIIKKLPEEIVCSKIELGLVFQNIISNGIKFKKENQPLEIRISCKTLPDCYEFSISDNGVGVEPDIIDQIFTPMVKSYSKQNAEGTGMGLATCEKIIKRHQGVIRVESDLGEGATFIFSISKNLKPNSTPIEFGYEELIA